MTPRGERIRDMADSFCRGKRHEAADRHVQSMMSFEQFFPDIAAPLLKRSRFDQARDDFLAGWDAAMNVRSDELLDENQTLHGIVLELCQRLCVERCKVCKGLGVDDEVNPCPHCDNGWIDKPEP
jgi:hypothetical protein